MDQNQKEKLDMKRNFFALFAAFALMLSFGNTNVALAQNQALSADQLAGKTWSVTVTSNGKESKPRNRSFTKVGDKVVMKDSRSIKKGIAMTGPKGIEFSYVFNDRSGYCDAEKYFKFTLTKAGDGFKGAGVTRSCKVGGQDKKVTVHLEPR